ncbi:MAG: ATP-binding protein [Polyangiales bacterium]
MARATQHSVTSSPFKVTSGEFVSRADSPLAVGHERYRLLVVAEDAAERGTLSVVASRHDALRDGVSCVVSWDEARARLAEERDDACVLAWTSAGRGPVELLRDAATSGRDTPIIVWARGEDPVGERVAMSLGAADWLVRPTLSPEELERAVRNAVSRAAALRALREREQRSRSAFESGDKSRLLVDDEGLCIDANAVARRAFGLPSGDLGRTDLASLLGPAARDVLASHWTGRDARPAYELTLRVQDPGGAQRTYEASVVPRAVPGGNLVVLRDVTGREEVRQRLALSERMLSLGTLASGMAHTINNPLQVLYSSIDLMQESLERARTSHGRNVQAEIDAVAFELASAREAAERVRRVVRDLAVFTRTDGGETSRVNLATPLETAIRLTENTIRHRATLVKEVRPVASVMGNEAQLTQVFVHLLLNAAQSIKQGSPAHNEVRVSVGRTADGRVQVSVSDTGHGMSPEVLGRVFDPFFTTRPVGEGAGLGLSVCHGTVASMGGEIVVESELGRGSTFRVLLPAVGVTGRPATVTPIPEPDAVPRSRVLVIDDDPMVCRSLTRLLQAHHDVEPITEAADGLSRIASGERFDVILCDVMMPEMSGVEFYQKLQVVAPEQAARVVFVTGGVFSPEARAFLDAGKHRVIEKPVTQGALYKALLRIVPQRA